MSITYTPKFEEWCNNCGKCGHKDANCWHVQEKQVLQIQRGATSATAGSSSSQISVTKTDDGTKETAFVEKVQEDTEMGWLFMIAGAMTTYQPSRNGAHSLVVDSGAPHESRKWLSDSWRTWLGDVLAKTRKFVSY